MRRGHMSRFRVVELVIATLVLLTFNATAFQTKDGPAVSITGVPRAGQGGPDATDSISGKAKGVDFREHRVVIYAFAANGVWYVQPTVASPLTLIDSNGNWENSTYLGRVYGALLVKKTYKPRPTMDALPDVGGDILAVDTVAGKK